MLQANDNDTEQKFNGKAKQREEWQTKSYDAEQKFNDKTLKHIT